MKRVALILIALFAVSFFAAAPALADHWNRGNCNHGYGGYGGYGGYSRNSYAPGGYGYHAVPGRVVVGYRSVGGFSGYNNYGYGYNSYNYGGYPYGGYGYNSGPSFGFYFSR